jgi:hypothetical protein
MSGSLKKHLLTSCSVDVEEWAKVCDAKIDVLALEELEVESIPSRMVRKPRWLDDRIAAD